MVSESQKKKKDQQLTLQSTLKKFRFDDSYNKMLIMIEIPSESAYNQLEDEHE